MKYKIRYSEAAELDIFDLELVIIEIYKSPLTAIKYIDGIYEEIEKLEYHAEIYEIQTRKYFRQFGHNVRRLNYKKMAIVYTIHGGIVYIRRIVPANTIIHI